MVAPGSKPLEVTAPGDDPTAAGAGSGAAAAHAFGSQRALLPAISEDVVDDETDSVVTHGASSEAARSRRWSRSSTGVSRPPHWQPAGDAVLQSPIVAGGATVADEGEAASDDAAASGGTAVDTDDKDDSDSARAGASAQAAYNEPADAQADEVDFDVDGRTRSRSRSVRSRRSTRTSHTFYDGPANDATATSDAAAETSEYSPMSVVARARALFERADTDAGTPPHAEPTTQPRQPPARGSMAPVGAVAATVAPPLAPAAWEPASEPPSAPVLTAAATAAIGAPLSAVSAVTPVVVTLPKGSQPLEDKQPENSAASVGLADPPSAAPPLHPAAVAAGRTAVSASASGDDRPATRRVSVVAGFAPSSSLVAPRAAAPAPSAGDSEWRSSLVSLRRTSSDLVAPPAHTAVRLAPALVFPTSQTSPRALPNLPGLSERPSAEPGPLNFAVVACALESVTDALRVAVDSVQRTLTVHAREPCVSACLRVCVSACLRVCVSAWL